MWWLLVREFTHWHYTQELIPPSLPPPCPSLPIAVCVSNSMLCVQQACATIQEVRQEVRQEARSPAAVLLCQLESNSTMMVPHTIVLGLASIVILPFPPLLPFRVIELAHIDRGVCDRSHCSVLGYDCTLFGMCFVHSLVVFSYPHPQTGGDGCGQKAEELQAPEGCN